MDFNQNRIDCVSQQSFCNRKHNHRHNSESIKHTGPDRSEEIFENEKNINRRDAHIQFSICVQFTKETTDFMRIIFIFNSIGYQAERKDRFECEKKNNGKKCSSFLHR